MNYFAHGYRFVDDPYFLAGTAVPDWLNVVDRQVRVRRKSATPWLADPDPRTAALARGIVQHHDDDAWFHETTVFYELNWRLTALVREAVGADDGFRPSFVGHILVEVLLDAALIREMPDRLEQYYAALARIDTEHVQAAVNRMSPRPTHRLAELLPLFSQERFLSDYNDDAKLARRLNQVMRRVGLPPLPAAFQRVLPTARRLIDARREELLRPIERNEAWGEAR